MSKYEERSIIEKLEGSSNWTAWKKMLQLHLLKSGTSSTIIGYADEPADDAAKAKREADDARALLDILSCLTPEVRDLVIGCGSAKEAWDVLVSVHEQSDDHRLDRLLGEFYRWTRDPADDIVAHVAGLQRHFNELNAALEKENESKLSERMLVVCILDTLGTEFHHFRDVWYALPRADRTLKNLVERLRVSESRETPKTAFLGKAKPTRPGESLKKCSSLAACSACKPSRNKRRNRRDSTRTGRKNLGRHRAHRSPSVEMPPPGTMQCTWG